MGERTKELFGELDRLSRLRARRLAWLWAAAAVGGLAAGLLCYHMADLALALQPAVRLALKVLFAAALSAGGAGALCRWLFRKDNAATALWLEGRQAGLRQDISTVVHCAGREGLSEDLIEALAERGLDSISRIGSGPAGSPRLSRIWAAAAAPLALLAAAALLWPSAAGMSVKRLLDPWAETGDWSGIEVVPGDARVPAGEELGVVVRGNGKRAYIYIDHGGRPSKVRPMKPDGPWARARLPRSGQGYGYRIVIGRMQSRRYRVSVYRPLVLGDIGVRVTPPAYTGLAPAELPNQGGIEAVKGSRAVVTARPSRPVASARAVFADGKSVGGAAAESSIVFTIEVREDGRYRLMAVSPDGADSFVSAEFPVTAVPDMPPRAELYGDDAPVALGGDMEVGIEGGGSDDYGLARMRIGYLLHGQVGRVQAWSFKRAVRDTAVALRWSLANMGLLPGDSLVYWLEALDNDAVSGPKEARSAARKLWVPSIAEMYRDMVREDSAAAAELAGVQPEQAELKEQIQRLSRAIKESRRVDWQQQSAIEKALADQQELLSRLERAADQALEAIRPEGRRVEIDAETASKLRELHQLFDQVATDEMRQAMERLSKALEKMDRQELARALENMELTSEDLKKRLDQAIAALKEMQQQQQLDRLRDGLDRLMGEQKEIREMTGALRNGEETDRLERRQQQAADDLEALAREARQLGENVGAQGEAGEKLKGAGESLMKQGTPQKMRQAGQRISQGARPAAMDLQRQALEEMAELAQGLESASSSMASARSRAMSQALRQKAREALSLSQQQEDLNRMLGQGGDPNDMAERQQSLSRAGARLQERSGGAQGLMIPPQAAGSLAKAARAMESCGQDIMGGRRGQSIAQGQEAVAALNQAAASLLEAASRSAGSQGGGDMMQELEGLSGQQSQINQQTLGLMPSTGGQEELSREARGQMARLAAEQQAVRQGLEEFDRKYADRRDRSDRLDDLIGEMEKAAEDLRRQRVDDRTRERQERILNRLLQAQRSLRDQDFSRQRKAETGKEPGGTEALRRNRPEGMPTPPADRDWRNEPYPAEYREIIERYFRSLGW